MKRTLFVLFFTMLLLSGAWALDSPPDNDAEYYYTRLMYSGLGVPERGGPFPPRYPPLRGFKCDDLERGEGGFGRGRRTDYPAADCNFVCGVQRLTSRRADRAAPHPIAL